MPRKAHSKAQFRLLKGISEGSIKPKGKLTSTVAEEMLGSQSPVGLPERAPAKARRRRKWGFK